MFRNIIVGMSGGVDSAVAAHLLKEKGFNVLGVFMRNWDEFDESGHCTGDQDLRDAEYACQHLQIELKQVNYVKNYWNSVFTNFLEDYQNGLTPNPDILCNRFIKFDLFYNYAIEQLKYDAIATGHYARSSYGSYFENYRADEAVRLLLPKDTFKDQTFFLSGIELKALKRTMFPLAGFYKHEVKELARKCGLTRLAQKKESTGICFVGKRDFKQFMEEYVPSRPGAFVDIDSEKIIGSHNGIHQWTVGQRCRFISYHLPYYVARKDAASNTIYAAAGHEHPALYGNRIEANNLNWLSPERLLPGEALRCRFRFQHTKPLVDCTVQRDENQTSDVIITLDKPLRALTPGQYAVFYNQTECLGSARIVQANSLESLASTNLQLQNKIS